MTTRKTLKDFLRTKMGVQQDRINYNLHTQDGIAKEGDDLGVEPGLEKQLLELNDENAGILGDYLSYLVELSSNTYKIAPGNEKAAPTNKGDALVLADEQGAENVFVNQGTVDAESLSSYADSGYFYGEDKTLGDLVDKTGAEGTPRIDLKSIAGRNLDKYGNTLPDQVGEDNKIVQATQEMLRRNNRFSNTVDASAYAPMGTTTESFENPQGNDDSGTVQSQTQFGNYKKNLKKVSLDSLKSIGASLLFKASGFDNADTPGKSSAVGNLEKEIAGTTTQLANTYTEEGYQKRSNNILSAKNAKGFPDIERTGRSTRAGKGVILPNDPDSFNQNSFGSTYNHAMPFTSPSTKSARIQTAATIVGMVKAVNDFFALIESLSSLKFHHVGNILDGNSPDYQQKEQKYEGPGPHMYGRNRPSISAKVDFLRKNLLSETIYPYGDCIETGMKVLFGSDNENVTKVSQTDTVTQANGFWQAVASSVLKSMGGLPGTGFGSLILGTVDFSEANIAASIRELSSNKVLSFMNVAAIIGDMFLHRSGGNKDLASFNKVIGQYDVDALPDGPGTRVSKSRSANGTSPLNLAWGSNTVPSMYLLPKNVVRAVSDLGTLTVGTNPIKGMLGSELINNTYLDATHDGSFNRIPQDVVKRLEDRLDAEYVPFYIQDTRTNEIISFHAFLTKLTDGIKANWTATNGYGRMDPVQIYEGATRTVNVGFTLYATSREDFDMMWYKINKLTTLLYPQWTKGTTVKAGANTFTQPFSQVMGASPIVRVRVGDVIKSNYSKFNLARIFGIGDKDTTIGDPTNKGSVIPVGGFRQIFETGAETKQRAVNSFQELGLFLFYLAYGTPFAATGMIKNAALKKTTENLLSNFLGNGFVNPLGLNLIMNQLTSPDQSPILPTINKSMASVGENFLTSAQFIKNGYSKLSIHQLKPTSKGYFCPSKGRTYLLDRSLRILVKDKKSSELIPEPSANTYSKDTPYKPMDRADFNRNRSVYEVQIIDFAAPGDLFNKSFLVYHEDILANPGSMFNRFIMPAFADPTAVAGLVQNIAREAAVTAGVGTDAVDILANTVMASNEKKFMLAENNPVVRAFDTNKGRGLAGVIDGFNFNWLEKDVPWEIDWNARAPIGVEIDFTLSVIHDLPPGLDHSGYNRAPLYNVGNIMKHVAGDPHDDDGVGSEFAFKNAGRSTFRTTKKRGE
jgi:hypothetical protein